MTALDEHSVITLPIRNLLAMAFAIAVVTAGWVNTDSRITANTHDIELQSTTVALNSDFRQTWPTQGLLPADVQQTSRLDAAELVMSNQATDLRELQREINHLKVTLGIIENRSSVAESKIESLYTLYNDKLVQAIE